MLFFSKGFLFAQETEQNNNIASDKIRMLITEDVNKAGNYAVCVVVQDLADYPYPRKTDMINRLLGRRGAIAYAYRKLNYIMLKDILPVVDNDEKYLTQDGFLQTAITLNTEFFDTNVKVDVGVFLYVTAVKLEELKQAVKDKYEIKYIKNMNKEYKGQKELISKAMWNTRLKNPDKIYVDEEKIAELDKRIQELG
jgi:hypothetical protein